MNEHDEDNAVRMRDTCIPSVESRIDQSPIILILIHCIEHQEHADEEAIGIRAAVGGSGQDLEGMIAEETFPTQARKRLKSRVLLRS